MLMLFVDFGGGGSSWYESVKQWYRDLGKPMAAWLLVEDCGDDGGGSAMGGW